MLKATLKEPDIVEVYTFEEVVKLLNNYNEFSRSVFKKIEFGVTYLFIDLDENRRIQFTRHDYLLDDGYEIWIIPIKEFNELYKFII